MRRRFVCHPRGYAGDRPIRLRNDDHLGSTVGVLPDDEQGLATPRMERIVNPPLDRVLAGSMSLLRAKPGSHGYRCSARAGEWRSCVATCAATPYWAAQPVRRPYGRTE